MRKKVLLMAMLGVACISLCACGKDKDTSSEEVTESVATSEEEETFESNMTKTEEEDTEEEDTEEDGWDEKDKPSTSPYTLPPVDEIMIGERKDTSQLSYEGTVITFNVPQKLYSVEAKGLENGVYEDFMYDSPDEEEELPDWYISLNLVNEGCNSETAIAEFIDENKEIKKDIEFKDYTVSGYQFKWTCFSFYDKDNVPATCFWAVTDVGDKMYLVDVISDTECEITPDSLPEFFNIQVQ